MAFVPSWACLLVGCISASLAVSSKISDVYPPLWEESPGQFNDYKVENEKYVIDIWNYSQRLGMYKILLNCTTKYFEKFAPDNEQNLLWGLPVHHGWQYHTGRLADPTHRTGCGYQPSEHLCLSVDSWWADVNYFLSIMPFLAAAEAGILGVSPDDVIFLPPPKDQKRFCSDVSGCYASFPEAMKNWNEFYQHVKSPSSSFDDLLKYIWDAHFSSLKVARKNFQSRSKYYSKPEADFQRNWALFVDYLAPPRFPTTLVRTYEFQKGLPARILLSRDKGPFIRDLTGFQNIVLLLLDFIHKVHKYTGSLLNKIKVLEHCLLLHGES